MSTYEDECKKWERKYYEEVDIVNRCWAALGISSYVGANGKSIYEHIEALKAKAEAVPTEALPPEADDLAAMARAARRYEAVKKCDWIGLRVDDQEFIGVSNLDAWADARVSPQVEPK